MVRNNQMAPLPPSCGKNCSDDTLSLLIMFDDLKRNGKVLSDGAGEEKFLQFVINQELCRRRWIVSEDEAQRLRIELQKAEQENKKLEMQLAQAREMLATETNLRKKSDNDRDMLATKWDLVKELISSEHGQTMNDETRMRLAKLEASVTNNRWGVECTMFKPGGQVGLSPVCEIDSTGSILDASDLSFDNTQGTFGGDDSKLRSERGYKRKSSGGLAQIIMREKKARNSGQELRKSLEAMAARKSVGGGEVAAGLEDALKHTPYEERNIDAYITSAPPMSSEEANVAWHNSPNVLHSEGRTATLTAKSPTRQCSSSTLTPSRTSTVTLTPQMTPYTPVDPVNRSNSNAGLNRKHQFVQKNNFKTEICGPCQKRIKFGKICFKCRGCRAIAHPECRENMPLPCVPVASTQKTPSISGQAFVIADYTPATSPMVPALVVHCVKEIEARGLGEVGLYRIPGSERDVRDLKEKFSAGRGCPNLYHMDIHTLTGVVKDFLRSLREPLIPSNMWHLFTQAASNPDMTDGESELYQAVSELPKPNRDTLAFMMLHLQKVSKHTETKMSVSNLARILGPTIVGYSCPDPSHEEMLKEVGAQSSIMEKLINVDSEYWRTFIDVDEAELLYPDDNNIISNTPECIFRTPIVEEVAKTPRMSIFGANRRVEPKKQKIFSSPVLL